MKKQTAGRDSLGEFAPKFAQLNDDVLFGQIWSREDKLSLRDRSIVTVCIFMGKGLVDDSLKYHLINARNNGLTKEEMAEIITHAAFYAGWPNAWAVFNMAKEVYADDRTETAHGGMFGMGEPNEAYAQYFKGNSYLKPLTEPGRWGMFMANVTFEPGCRNNWHIHHADKGGGQTQGCRRRRTNTHMCRRRRLVSGTGQGGKEPNAGRYSGYSCQCKTLARGQERLLVQPYSY